MKHRILTIYCVLCLVVCAGCGILSDNDNSASNSTPPAKDLSLYLHFKNLTPTDEMPGDSSIKDVGFLSEASSDKGDVLANIPAVNGQSAQYSVVVYNKSSASITCGVCPFDVSSSSKCASKKIKASVPAKAPSELHRAWLKQSAVRSEIIKRSLKRLSARSNLRGSLRGGEVEKSDNRGEEQGKIYKISIISDSLGRTHCERYFKLVRILDHAKFFIDKGPCDASEPINDASNCQISDSDIGHLATEFENYIYPLMSRGYGDVFDIDQDGRISYLFSPVYQGYGFAGLFDSYCLEPDCPKAAKRDYVGIWTPNNNSRGDKWLLDARETMAHELQHAILYSSRIYPNGRLRDGLSSTYVSDGGYEETWLDESLAVGAEARYRLERGQTDVYDARFDVYTNDAENLNSLKLTEWSADLANYGQKGLFNFYLYSAYGADKIKELVKGGGGFYTGETNIEAVYKKSMSTLAKDFSVALCVEAIRRTGTGETMVLSDNIASKYKFAADTGITFASQDIKFNEYALPVTIKPGASAYFCLTQPKDYKGNYPLRINAYQSSGPAKIDVMLMRVN